MKSKQTLFMLLVLALTALPAYAAGGALDGKTFKGKVWTEGDPGDPDSFIFKAGEFRSTACDQYGYGSAPYTVSDKNGVKSFTATTKNKNGAEMHWEGSVKGNDIEGSAVMKTQSGEETPMKFAGKLE